jgi:FtsH-binding integral membrane protein
MSWTDWACLGIIVLGFVLFLYGANYFDATIGWAGVYLFVGALLARLILYIYDELTKKTAQNPVERAVLFFKIL